MNILFVCTGNISRSFLAERLLKHEIGLHKLDNITVSSAGLFAFPGNPADPVMVDYLSKSGVSTESHESRQITAEDVEWADLILVMERNHVRELERLWPTSREKIELLGTFVSEGHDADDIVDPFGKSIYYYRIAQSQITLAVRSLVIRVLLDQTGEDQFCS